MTSSVRTAISGSSTATGENPSQVGDAVPSGSKAKPTTSTTPKKKTTFVPMVIETANHVLRCAR